MKEQTHSSDQLSLESLRNLWRRTDAGRSTQNVGSNNELQDYLQKSLFHARMRLGLLKGMLAKETTCGLNEEIDKLENELQVCSQAAFLLFNG